MVKFQETFVFTAWLAWLRDRGARQRIIVRLRRLGDGNAGQTRNLRAGVSELKIDYGPGYRVSFTRRGSRLIVLLAGGDKKSQGDDIEESVMLARDWIEDDEDGD